MAGLAAFPGPLWRIDLRFQPAVLKTLDESLPWSRLQALLGVEPVSCVVARAVPDLFLALLRHQYIIGGSALARPS